MADTGNQMEWPEGAGPLRAYSPFDVFCNELDELIGRWEAKPLDDQITGAQVVGALHFSAHNLMVKMQNDAKE